MKGSTEWLTSMLDKIEPNRRSIFLTTIELFAETCKRETALSVVMIVRSPSPTDDMSWMLSITALNADTDDTFEMVDVAHDQLLEKITEEAPAREHYN